MFHCATLKSVGEVFEQIQILRGIRLHLVVLRDCLDQFGWNTDALM